MNNSTLFTETGIPLKHEALTGLTSAQVLDQRARYGENRLPSEKGVSAWTILFNQFKSPLVYIILTAAAVSLALGELGDFAIALLTANWIFTAVCLFSIL